MQNKKAAVLLLLLITGLSGCVLQRTSPKEFVCPAVSQNCQSTRWVGLPVDTSEEYRNVADYYYLFENVRQVNSAEDEWSLSFLDKNKAILTLNDGGVQRMLMYRIVSENRGTLESGIGAPIEGNIGSISVRGKTAALAVSPTIADNEALLGNSDIYTADLQENVLINVKKIDGKLSDNRLTWESHPALSPDGRVIIFSSDRNAIHGTDLFMIIKMQDGSWSEPIYLGDSVNSSCDEVTPFITSDSRQLLFASNGLESIGGYDIFSAIISDEFWDVVRRGDLNALKTNNYFSQIKNLRPPLNTFYDELFPSSPGDISNILYYSSNQYEASSSLLVRKGGFDIFVRRRVASERLAENQQKLIAQDITPDFNVNLEKLNKTPDLQIRPTYMVEGTVFNAATNEVVPRADISVLELKTDTTKLETERLLDQGELELVSQWKEIYYESFRTKADEKGDYEVELEKGVDYLVAAQAPNLFFDSRKIRVEKENPLTSLKIDFRVPEKLTLRINFPTDVYKSPYKYALDSNGVETNRKWQEELSLLARNILQSLDKLVKVTFIGHTDDVGSEEYNYKLALNRVNFVIEELVKRGVPRDKLEGKSAGKLEPLPKLPGEQLQAYRKRLRRVELLKELK